MIYGGSILALSFSNDAGRDPETDFSDTLALEGDPADGVGSYATVQGTSVFTNSNYTLAFKPDTLPVGQAAIKREIKAINQPLDMMPTLNSAKGRSTVLIKFTVVNESGKQVTSVDGITVNMRQVNRKTYESGPSDPIEVTTSTGNTTLRLDGTQFI